MFTSCRITGNLRKEWRLCKHCTDSGTGRVAFGALLQIIVYFGLYRKCKKQNFAFFAHLLRTLRLILFCCKRTKEICKNSPSVHGVVCFFALFFSVCVAFRFTPAACRAIANTPGCVPLIPRCLQRSDTATSFHFSTRALAIHSPAD